MTQVRSLLSRYFLVALVIAPLSIIVLLTMMVLVPTIKNPQSQIYGSAIGYPALKRLIGKSIKVQAAPVEKATFKEGVAAPGESVALKNIDVFPLVSGIVKEAYVVEGERVLTGEPLFKIQQDSFQDEVNSAQNDLALAKRNMRTLPKLHPERISELKANVITAKRQLNLAVARLEQLQLLEKEGAAPGSQLLDAQEQYLNSQNSLVVAQQRLAQQRIIWEQELESTRLDLENKQINLREAHRNLKNTVVYASTTGLVSKIDVHSGEVATTQSSAITLTSDVVFKAYIDQAQLEAVEIGDQATVRLVAYPGRTYEGKVIRLNPTVETEANPQGENGLNRQYTYSAWIRISNAQISPEMPPGLQGYAQFNEVETSLVIPESAVVHLSAGEGMVMVAENNRAVAKKVKLRNVFENRREVLSGLAIGQKVLLYPRALDSGDKIKVGVAE